MQGVFFVIVWSTTALQFLTTLPDILEAGKTNMTIKILCLICNALNVDIKEVLAEI